MPEIAPWENPNLPAPFATIEREIENRKRRFALWRWEERIVWRDLKNTRLWWATLDVAASLDDWEGAIEKGQFGRAFSESCYFSGRGEIVGFDRSVLFSCGYCHDFYILLSAEGSGVACWSQSENWENFKFNSYKRLKKSRRKLQVRHKLQDPLPIPIWRSNFQPPSLGNTLLGGFGSTFVQALSPNLTQFLQNGERAELFQAVKYLVVCQLRLSPIRRYQLHYFVKEINRQYPDLISKLCQQFGLPTDLNFALTKSRIPDLTTFSCSTLVENTAWMIHSRLQEPSTAHELLELQLRLRDALRPILTPTEIEEILTFPARR